MKTAKRMEQMKRAVWSREKPADAIDFTLGSPDIAPDKTVLETISSEAAKPENYRYAVKALPELEGALEDWYARRYGVDLAPENLALLQGSQEALVNLPLVFCDPGDVVLVPDPNYPIYAKAPLLAGADVHLMPLEEKNGYLPDLKAIPEDVLKRAKMILVSYPNNPTGATAPDSFYEELIAFAKKHGLLVVHDNAYSDLVFDGKPGKSFLSFPGAMDVGVELNSFSKTYGMAGARIGVLAGNPDVINAYKDYKSQVDYGIFVPIQKGAVAALQEEPESIEKTKQAYEHRRDVLVDAFAKAGWSIPKSAATMFLWAPVPVDMDDRTFADRLAQKTGVLVTPGSEFGPAGKGHVRIALVQDEDKIKEAARRIAKTNLAKL